MSDEQPKGQQTKYTLSYKGKIFTFSASGISIFPNGQLIFTDEQGQLVLGITGWDYVFPGDGIAGMQMNVPS